jgi:hypothetical protein
MLIGNIYMLCRCTAVKIVKGFGTENPEIAPLAGNGKRVGGDERAGTLVLDDNDANEPEECAAASRGKGHVWGRRNSFFFATKLPMYTTVS